MGVNLRPAGIKGISELTNRTCRIPEHKENSSALTTTSIEDATAQLEEGGQVDVVRLELFRIIDHFGLDEWDGLTLPRHKERDTTKPLKVSSQGLHHSALNQIKQRMGYYRRLRRRRRKCRPGDQRGHHQVGRTQPGASKDCHRQRIGELPRFRPTWGQ